MIGRTADETTCKPSVRGLQRFGRVERGSEALFLAVVASAVPKAGMPDTSRVMLADDLAVFAFTQDVVKEEILRDRNIPFHAQNLGDVGDAARAVAQALRLHND